MMNLYLYTVIVLLVSGGYYVLYFSLYRKLFDKLEKVTQENKTTTCEEVKQYVGQKMRWEMTRLFGDNYSDNGKFNYGAIAHNSKIKTIIENVLKEKLEDIEAKMLNIETEKFIDKIIDRIKRKQLK